MNEFFINTPFTPQIKATVTNNSDFLVTINNNPSLKVSLTAGYVGIIIYTIYFLFPNVGGWDNLVLPMASVKKDNSITLLQVDCTAIGSTNPSITFNIEERIWGSFNSSGTSITSSSITATSTGTSVTSFSNSTIAARGGLFLTTSNSAASGSVDFIMGTVYYIVNS